MLPVDPSAVQRQVSKRSRRSAGLFTDSRSALLAIHIFQKGYSQTEGKEWSAIRFDYVLFSAGIVVSQLRRISN